MKIRTRILGALLGMSLLVALVGALAVNRQRAAATESATMEAENVAEALGLAVISDAGELDPDAQEIIKRLHATEGRDVVLVDLKKRVLADANPHSIGEVFVEDQHEEVAATIKDGRPRTFVEISTDHPAGIKQIVARVQSNSGATLGAVILEYGPLYDALIKANRSTVGVLILAGLGSAVIALLIAFYLGHSIGRPLEQLTLAALEFASGRADLPLPPPRQDEIGKLALAFAAMVERRQRAEENLQRLHSELEGRVLERTAELAKANAALHTENIERQRTEDTLRESKHFAESIAQNSTSIIYLFDIESSRNTYSNRSLAEFLGYSQTQVLALGDQLLATIIHPADLIKVARHFEHFSTVADDRVVDLEYRVKHASGEWHWIWSRDTVFKRRPNGAAWQVMGTAQDITEQKRAAAELDRVHKQLLETSRHAGMAEVATGVLHNVGNVLNSVNISAALVADSVRKSKITSLGRVVASLEEHATDLGAYVTTDSQGRNLPGFLRQLHERLLREQQAILAEAESLRENIEHIKEIVSMQQEYAKVSGATEILQVTDLVEDSLRMNAESLERHAIAVEREFQEVPPIAIEKHKALQIMVNLIRNAKCACDAGGREDKRITLRVTNGGGWIKISVSDNGIGIPPQNLTRIFNHGFTTWKNGHGFGLHTSALAAREMGGALRAESNGAGGGATFTLELPVSNTEAR